MKRLQGNCALTLTNNFFQTTGFNVDNASMLFWEGTYAGTGSSNIASITGNTFKGISDTSSYNNGNGQSLHHLNLGGVQGTVSNNIFNGSDIGVTLANACA